MLLGLHLPVRGRKGLAYGEKAETGESALQTAQTVVMIASDGDLLGALGLLNVAIVTVRQRIREIGIRRATVQPARPSRCVHGVGGRHFRRGCHWGWARDRDREVLAAGKPRHCV